MKLFANILLVIAWCVANSLLIALVCQGCSTHRPVEFSTQPTYDCTAVYNPDRQVYEVNCPDLHEQAKR